MSSGCCCCCCLVEVDKTRGDVGEDEEEDSAAVVTNALKFESFAEEIGDVVVVAVEPVELMFLLKGIKEFVVEGAEACFSDDDDDDCISSIIFFRLFNELSQSLVSIWDNLSVSSNKDKVPGGTSFKPSNFETCALDLKCLAK